MLSKLCGSWTCPSELAATWTEPFWGRPSLEAPMGTTNPWLTFKLSVSLHGWRLFASHARKSSENETVRGDLSQDLKICFMCLQCRTLPIFNLLTLVHWCEVLHLGCHLVPYKAWRIVWSAATSPLAFWWHRWLWWIFDPFGGHVVWSETHQWCRHFYFRIFFNAQVGF